MSPNASGADALHKAADVVVKNEDSSRGRSSTYQKDLLKWARNVDQGYAWVVLAALWFMMTATLGSYRLYGLIFAEVTSREIYTREEASWPVSTILTVENITGPFVSVIAYHISYRWSMFIGGSLLVLGNGLTGLSRCLIVDVLLIGLVQGIGYAFIFMPFMEVINSYFVKYRSMALGLALSGGTISVFVWSPLTQWMLVNCPWRYSYFALSLICSLNLVMVPLLKPNPRPHLATQRDNKPEQDDATRSDLSRVSLKALSFQNSQRRPSTILIACQAGLRRQSSLTVVSVDQLASSANLDHKIPRAIIDNCNPNDHSGPDKQTSPRFVPEDEAISPKELENDSRFELSIIWDVIKTPAFHLIWYNELLYYWIFSIYSLVMVDYGVDSGCSKDEAENLLNYFSIGELVGRLGLTALVDMKFMSIRNVVVLDLVALGVSLVAMTCATGFVWMATLTMVVSAILSLLYILLNGLLVDALGERRVTIGYGMASCIGGILISFRPQAVGYVRDELKTYDPLLVSLAIACFVGAALWLIEPLVMRFCRNSAESEQNL